MRLVVEAPATAALTALGDSVSIDGVDLTATEIADGRMTLQRRPRDARAHDARQPRAPAPRSTSSPRCAPASRSAGTTSRATSTASAASARSSATASASASRSRRRPSLLRYVVEKGSVAVHGVALTVTHVDDETFGVALIPHTLAETTLGTIAVGDELNLEVDVLGKYVERLIASRIPSSE